MAIPQVSIPSGSGNINTLKRMASAGLSDSETTRQTNGSSELMARVTRLRGSGLDNRRRKRKKRKVSVTKALASSLKTLVVSPSTPSSSGSLKVCPDYPASSSIADLFAGERARIRIS